MFSGARLNAVPCVFASASETPGSNANGSGCVVVPHGRLEFGKYLAFGIWIGI
jgi:hypothetical protein